MSYRFVLLTVFVALISLASKPVNAASVKPVELVLFVAADADLPVAEAANVAQVWGAEVDAWFRREVGKGVAINFRVIQSTSTRFEIAQGNVDACGDIGGEAAGQRVFSEITQAGIPDFGTERLWVVMLGAGGWAGASYFGQGQTDYGRMLVGDWNLRYAVSGQHSPCDPYRPTQNLSGPFGHEALHTMNVDSHNPSIFTWGVMSAAQKRDLLRNNKAFLY